MPDPNSGDQTEEIVHDLLQAERQKEITQATTLQGQIVALVLILVDAEVLSFDDVNRWEGLSEHVQALLQDMAFGSEALESGVKNQDTVKLRVKGVKATIELLRLMGNKDRTLSPLADELRRLTDMLKSMKEEQ